MDLNCGTSDIVGHLDTCERKIPVKTGTSLMREKWLKCPGRDDALDLSLAGRTI